ncbi:MAG: hypothetical protein IJ960_06745 [Oscillospiraceae bacterium]|nr:hypothetical protein [Oscillospiraceae bacterium]
MIAEQLKNWIKAQDAAYEGRIQLGGVNGNAPFFLGVYPAAVTGKQHIAVGGPACTRYGVFAARLLLRWGKSQIEAERQARSLWGLFYGLTDVDMDGAKVAFVESSADPVPLGKGADGVFEYAINLTIYYMKE